MSTVQFECTRLQGTGKTGKLTPDSDGYYEVILGAYGVNNSAGMFYDQNSAMKLFTPDSPLIRRLEKGVLYAELGHPSPAGFKSHEFLARVHEIKEDRLAAHIKSIRLDPDFKDRNGKKMCAVIGKVKPCAPHGQVVKEALEEGSRNAYFSVRSITRDDTMRGIKYTEKIINWDFVIEGGIHVAEKYLSPSLEQFGNEDSTGFVMDIDQSLLWKTDQYVKENQLVGLENGQECFSQLAKDLGMELYSEPRGFKSPFAGW